MNQIGVICDRYYCTYDLVYGAVFFCIQPSPALHFLFWQVAWLAILLNWTQTQTLIMTTEQ